MVKSQSGMAVTAHQIFNLGAALDVVCLGDSAPAMRILGTMHSFGSLSFVGSGFV